MRMATISEMMPTFSAANIETTGEILLSMFQSVDDDIFREAVKILVRKHKGYKGSNYLATLNDIITDLQKGRRASEKKQKYYRMSNGDILKMKLCYYDSALKEERCLCFFNLHKSDYDPDPHNCVREWMINVPYKQSQVLIDNNLNESRLVLGLSTSQYEAKPY